jgi:hypothetical protein
MSAHEQQHASKHFGLRYHAKVESLPRQTEAISLVDGKFSAKDSQVVELPMLDPENNGQRGTGQHRSMTPTRFKRRWTKDTVFVINAEADEAVSKERENGQEN